MFIVIIIITLIIFFKPVNIFKGLWEILLYSLGHIKSLCCIHVCVCICVHVHANVYMLKTTLTVN